MIRATIFKQYSLFFKHYINNLCENKRLVIIYSGGDDVFIVGDWEGFDSRTVAIPTTPSRSAVE